MELLGTGQMFRSADMEYVSLIVAEHLAHDVLSRLGEIGVTQFTDVRESDVQNRAPDGEI